MFGLSFISLIKLYRLALILSLSYSFLSKKSLCYARDKNIDSITRGLIGAVFEVMEEMVITRLTERGRPHLSKRAHYLFEFIEVDFASCVLI
jgi:hypothetical protein